MIWIFFISLNHLVAVEETSSGTVVHIAWVDAGVVLPLGQGTDIVYRSKVGGSWTTTEVVSTGSTLQSENPSLAVEETSSGTVVHIAWVERFKDVLGYGYYINYRSKKNAIWNPIEFVSTGSTGDSRYPSLAVNPSGTVHVAWADNTNYGKSSSYMDLFYKSKPLGGSWPATPEIVWTRSPSPTSVSWDFSLAVEETSSGTVVHIVWADTTNYGASGSDRDIFYRSKVGGSWTTTEVVSTESTEHSGWYNGVSLGVDTMGIAHVAWEDLTNYGNSGSDQDIFYKKQSCCCPGGMVGYWKLDKKNGPVIDSFDGNHGTNYGAMRDRTGKVDKAFNFNGNNNYVEIPNVYNLGNGDFTLEAWINADANQKDYPTILSNRGNVASTGFLFGLSLWDQAVKGSLFLQIQDVNYVTCSTDLRNKGWQHVAVTRSGNSITFYVNGAKDGDATSANSMNSNGELWIGMDEASQSNTPWSGLIDEVAIWNECLSASEIWCHYNLGSSGHGYNNIDIKILTGYKGFSGIDATLTNNGPCITDLIHWEIKWTKGGTSGGNNGDAGPIPVGGHQDINSAGPGSGFGLVSIEATADCCYYTATARGFVFFGRLIVFNANP